MEVALNKTRENEVYINPLMRKPKALRAMLPVLLSRPVSYKAAGGGVYPFCQERENKKAF